MNSEKPYNSPSPLNSNNATPRPSTPNWMLWTGRVLSALTMPLFAMSAFMKLSKNPMAVDGFAKFGFGSEMLVNIGILEVICMILYIIPQTAVLGAILLTGYLGGAIVVHLHQNDSFLPPLIIGVILWIGLYLRDARVRSLAPWRSL